jgi:hypothetical protein
METKELIVLPLTLITLIAGYLAHEEVGRLGLANQTFQSAIMLYY